jgi:hypothetical protein
MHRHEELLWQAPALAHRRAPAAFIGVPFLRPWASRLGGYQYRTGGQDVTLDPASQLLLLGDHRLATKGVLGLLA